MLGKKLLLIFQIIFLYSAYAQEHYFCKTESNFTICKLKGVITSIERISAINNLSLTIRDVDAEIDIDHGAFKNLQVEILKIAGPGLLNLYPSSFEGLPRLYQLRIERHVVLKGDMFAPISGTLSSLSININTNPQRLRFALENLEKLKTLELLDTDLRVIKGGFYPTSSPVTNLAFTRGNITTIEPKAFSAFKVLNTFAITNHKLTSFTSDAFYNVHDIVDLSLASNNRHHIKKNMFNEMTMLKWLDLDNNFIETIETGSFFGLTLMISLSLKDNRLAIIQSQCFKGLITIDLNLLGNDHVRIANNAFERADIGRVLLHSKLYLGIDTSPWGLSVNTTIA